MHFARRCTSAVGVVAGSSADLSDEALARQELGKRAYREVQVARRRKREAEDEVACLIYLTILISPYFSLGGCSTQTRPISRPPAGHRAWVPLA